MSAFSPRLERSALTRHATASAAVSSDVWEVGYVERAGATLGLGGPAGGETNDEDGDENDGSAEVAAAQSGRYVSKNGASRQTRATLVWRVY